MDKKLKDEILHSLHTIYLQRSSLENSEAKLNDLDDIFNLVKFIDGWDEFKPDIKRLLNEKAARDKFKSTTKYEIEK